MQKKPSTRSKGDEGEEIAVACLQQHGLEIIQRNYRFERGEIDIVAMDGDVLVFCEVKTRENDDFGPPEAAITPRKQAQMRKVAEGYLYEHGITEQKCRFDVVAIRMYGKRADVKYLPDAFT
jgi:putative endonuclease